MINVEHRKMFRPNGLIDDFVVRGSASDYIAFASLVRSAISSGKPQVVRTASHIAIEVEIEDGSLELFTSLQNRENLYTSMSEWEQRDILRVSGGSEVLEALCTFLQDLSGRGEGYSYLSEYSEHFAYASSSPPWRLHVHAR